MKLIVTGSHGFLGSHLVQRFRQEGNRVVALVRGESQGPNEISWHPQKGEIDAKELEGVDAVIHLAGRNIVDARWNEKIKREIWESRIQGTKLLAEAVAMLTQPPRVFISASAIGFYGDRGEERLDEGSPRGEGFLARLCEAWEAATAKVTQRGIRVVNVRTGLVLSQAGGVLAKMLPIFKRGLGGRLGSGQQFISWITLEDYLRAIEFLLRKEMLSGPVNVVTLNPVTNAAFINTLAAAVQRPAFLHVPAFLLKLAAGEMAQELFLASAQVIPRRLTEAGFAFLHPTLPEGLAAAL